MTWCTKKWLQHSLAKGNLVIVLGLDLDLAISQESTHEGKDLVARTFINNLINEKHQVIVFGTNLI